MMTYQNSIKSFLYWVIGISLFTLPLIHAWWSYPLGVENFYTNYAAIGGMLPWSDAQDYYRGAHNLLENGFLDHWNIRRPLNAILFSIRLWVANNNFQIALIIQAILSGISCTLVAATISHTFGKLASVVTLFILFLFAAVFIPTTLSETLGLTIGCFGFVLLWQAMNSKSKFLFFVSGLMLMVGLNVRAGAFFILPLLIVWLGLHFRKQKINSKFNLPISAAFTIGLIGGFLFNLMLIKLYCGTDAMIAPHGNFAHTLFGLVSGGQGWRYAYTKFPDISNQSEAAVVKFLYYKSFETFIHNPVLLILGILKSWGGALKSTISFFQYQLPNSIILKTLIRLTGAIILCICFYRMKCLYKNYRNEIGLISIVLLGMFLSAGGIWTDGGFRVFAVTVPFFAATLGIVASSFVPNRLTTSHQLSKPLDWGSHYALIFSGFLLLSGLLGPKLIPYSKPASIARFSCPTEQTKIVVNKISGAPHIELSRQKDLFKKSITRSLIENKQDFLRILEPNILAKASSLGFIFEINTNQTKYVLGPPELFTKQHNWVGLCTTQVSGVDTIMEVKSYEVLSEK